MRIYQKVFGWLVDRRNSWWPVRLTPAGWFVLAGMMLSSLSLVSAEIPLYQLFAALLTLFVLSFGIGLLFIPRVAVTGRFPAKATAGYQISGKFKVTNRSRRTIYDVSVGLFRLPEPVKLISTPKTIELLGPGESSEVTIELRPERRGLFHLPDLSAYTTFPFNLFRWGGHRHRLGSLLVLPSFHPLASVELSPGTSYQPGGVALSSHVGESPEYIGSREYLPGESVRKFDYRAWARLGVPAVREFREEYYSRVGLTLDTFIPSSARRKRRYPLQASVRLAASVAEALSRGETLINVFAAGPELYTFEAGRHTAHLENVLEILACIDACRESPYDRLGAAIADQLDRISAMVCIFLDWDHPQRDLARMVIESGCHLKLIIVRDGDSRLPLDESEFHDIQVITPASILKGKVQAI